jgi:hypothetical protein
MFWELVWLPPLTLLLYRACSKEAREWLHAKAYGLDGRPRRRFVSVVEKSVAQAQLRFRKAPSGHTPVGLVESISDTWSVDAKIIRHQSQAKSLFSLCPAR